MDTSLKDIQLCIKEMLHLQEEFIDSLTYIVFLKCRLGLEAKKEENLADWYSQVHCAYMIL